MDATLRSGSDDAVEQNRGLPAWQSKLRSNLEATTMTTPHGNASPIKQTEASGPLGRGSEATTKATKITKKRNVECDHLFGMHQ
jgi:hypothetical protein